MNGSSRDPNFEAVRRTPFATARILPCCLLSIVTMRSASPSLWVRSTTASSRYRGTYLVSTQPLRSRVALADDSRSIRPGREFRRPVARKLLIRAKPRPSTPRLHDNPEFPTRPGPGSDGGELQVVGLGTNRAVDGRDDRLERRSRDVGVDTDTPDRLAVDTQLDIRRRVRVAARAQRVLAVVEQLDIAARAPP